MTTHRLKFTIVAGAGRQVRSGLFIASVAAVMSVTAVPGARALELRGTAWQQVAEEVQPSPVDPYLLFSVCLYEARVHAGNEVQPWPWTLATRYASILSDTREDAVRVLRNVPANQQDKVDVGLCQLNVQYHRAEVDDVADLLEPKTNLRLAAFALSKALSSAPNDLELGVGHYHAWGEAKARPYGRQVLRIYRRLKETR